MLVHATLASFSFITVLIIVVILRPVVELRGDLVATSAYPGSTDRVLLGGAVVQQKQRLLLTSYGAVALVAATVAVCAI